MSKDKSDSADKIIRKSLEGALKIAKAQEKEKDQLTRQRDRLEKELAAAKTALSEFDSIKAELSKVTAEATSLRAQLKQNQDYESDLKKRVKSAKGVVLNQIDDLKEPLRSSLLDSLNKLGRLEEMLKPKFMRIPKTKPFKVGQPIRKSEIYKYLSTEEGFGLSAPEMADTLGMIERNVKSYSNAQIGDVEQKLTRLMMVHLIQRDPRLISYQATPSFDDMVSLFQKYYPELTPPDVAEILGAHRQHAYRWTDNRAPRRMYACIFKYVTWSYAQNGSKGLRDHMRLAVGIHDQEGHHIHDRVRQAISKR